MVVIFIELKSKLTYLGPRSTLRPALPKTSCGVGVPMAERFHQLSICLGPLLGFPVMSQLSCSNPTMLVASSLVVRQDVGRPVRTTLMPPICQPTSCLTTNDDATNIVGFE